MTYDQIPGIAMMPAGLRSIGAKVFAGERISPAEGVYLFTHGEPGFLGILASHARIVKNGDRACFIRNFHVEPTNICVNRCSFCSYSHHFSHTRWELSPDDILAKVMEQDLSVNEIHITGAVHPDRDLAYYCELLARIRKARPNLHIKAYSAVEIDFMCRKSGVSVEQGLSMLKEAGLDSVPGGGAEIFDEAVRDRLCGMKTSSAHWLMIHETAHRIGIPSNATMLYGHGETLEHRIDHLCRLRDLQDRTGGFNAFIPLKFRNANNEMSHIEEVSVIEDMKMYAMSRIFLDNFPHIKAYWPAIGRKFAQVALSFGVDDMDGTINDSTRIYSLAGAEEENPVMSVSEMVQMIREAGRVPVERDSLYREIRVYEPESPGTTG